MLPDFPIQKAFVATEISKAIAGRMKKDPLISMIHIHQMHEGSAVEIQSPEWKDHVEMTEVGFQGEVSLEDLVREGPDIYFKQALQAAEAFIEAHHKMLMSKADEVTQRSGMVVDAHGKPFTPELLLQALERMELAFAETGEAKMPTLILHPQLLESIKEKMPEWEKDEDLRARWAQLIERKRKEWIDRENSRKLVD